MKNAATSAATTTSTTSLPLFMEGSWNPDMSVGEDGAVLQNARANPLGGPLIVARAFDDPAEIRSVGGRTRGPAREEPRQPAFAVVVELQRFDVDRAALDPEELLRTREGPERHPRHDAEGS